MQAAGRQLGIASQLSQELLQARWIALLNRIGRDRATKLLSLTQALDAALIQRHESSWDWAQLSRNEALPWSLKLIERFKDRWKWWWEREFGPWPGQGLSGNSALPWSLELIERYEDQWDWGEEEYCGGLSGNRALPWSLELIERFEDRWDWHHAEEVLRRKKALILSSSAVNGLMTYFADQEHAEAVAQEIKARECRPEPVRFEIASKNQLLFEYGIDATRARIGWVIITEPWGESYAIERSTFDEHYDIQLQEGPEGVATEKKI